MPPTLDADPARAFARRCERLFEFDSWAMNRVFDALAALASPPAQAVSRIEHIVWAAELWLTRVQGVASPPESALRGIGLPALRIRSQACGAAWLALARRSNDADLARLVHYRNTKQLEFENTVGDIMTHVVNHATYHRGQIASDLKGLRAEPVPTDFIVFARGQ